MKKIVFIIILLFSSLQVFAETDYYTKKEVEINMLNSKNLIISIANQQERLLKEKPLTQEELLRGINLTCNVKSWNNKLIAHDANYGRNYSCEYKYYQNGVIKLVIEKCVWVSENSMTNTTYTYYDRYGNKIGDLVYNNENKLVSISPPQRGYLRIKSNPLSKHFKQKLKYIGNKEVYYDVYWRILKIGNDIVKYSNEDGKMLSIGNKVVKYDNNDNIVKIGNDSIIYKQNGDIKSIGTMIVKYDSEGYITQIGSYKIQYLEQNRK